MAILCYEFEDELTTVDCRKHNTDREVLVCGCVSGEVNILSATCNGTKRNLSMLWTKYHKQSVRKARFTSSGDSFFTITSNYGLCEWDLEKCRKRRCIRRCHPHKPYSLAVISCNQIVTGDESGRIRLWDWRRTEAEPVAEFRNTHDYITDLASDASGKILLASAGDARLYAFSVDKRTFLMHSETMHSELLCVCTAKRDNKVLCGAADGYFEVFKFGEYGNISDRIDSGHEESVDCVRNVGNSDHVVSGSADGTLRLHSVAPNRGNVALLGDHGAAVEDIAVSADQKYLLSVGLDCNLKVWSIDASNSDYKITKVKGKKPVNFNKHGGADFFKDISI